MHTNSQSIPVPAQQPLAFHIRRLRQWYGTEGLTQEELAAIAGVSKRTVEEYERYTTLPPQVAVFVAITLALGQPFNRVIAPAIFEKLSKEIEARRATFHQAPDFGSVLTDAD